MRIVDRGAQAGRYRTAGGWRVCPRRVNGSDEEQAQGLLEGGNGTGIVGEGGVQMSQDLGRQRSSCGIRGHLGRWAKSQECRADSALGEVEALADTLPGSVAQMAGGGANGGPQAAGEEALEKGPQSARGEAESTNPVCEPDAEGASAAESLVTIATEDASCPQRLPLWAGVVKSVQSAMAHQKAYGVAVGTRGQLELLDDGVPLVVAAKEAW
jgi:hypothetical protein